MDVVFMAAVLWIIIQFDIIFVLYFRMEDFYGMCY